MGKREKTELICKTALSVFSRYGYKKTTVEDIAGELGMTKGNVYLYMKDKKDLYHKTVTYALLRWQNRVAGAIHAETDVKKQFLAMCHSAMEYLWKDKELLQVLARDHEIFPIFPCRDPFGRINKNSMKMIEDILARGIREKAFREVDMDLVPQVVFSIYRMFIVQSYTNPRGKSVKKMFYETVRLVTEGLFAEPLP